MKLKSIIAMCSLSIIVLLSPNIARSEQRQDVLKFMKISGLEDGLHDSANFYRDELKKNYPKLQKSFYKELDDELDSYVKDVENYYVKMYSQKFTVRDMNQILLFFSTPSGKKFAKVNIVFLPDVGRYASSKIKLIDLKVENRLKLVKQ